MNTTENDSKNGKNGKNILQKIDFKPIVDNFISFYFTNLSIINDDTSNQQLLTLFNQHSRIMFSNNVYLGLEQIYTFFVFFKSNCQSIQLENYQMIESGSRRVDILINGIIMKDNQSYKFSQYIFLCHTTENKQDKWWIQNSILNI